MWLFEKKFKRRAPPWFMYVPSIFGMLLCYMTLSEHRSGDMTSNIVALSVTSACVLFAIGMSLRQFVRILQKPYQGGNLHIALGSVLATVVMFAAIYSMLYLYLPNAFYGMSGATPLDECVNVIYFSVATLTTVGFGDIYPVSYIAKAFVTIEMMSFFVFFVLILGNHRVFIKPKEAQKHDKSNSTDIL